MPMPMPMSMPMHMHMHMHMHMQCRCGPPPRSSTHLEHDDARVHLPFVEPLALGAVRVRLIHGAHHAAASGLEGALLLRVGGRG